MAIYKGPTRSFKRTNDESLLAVDDLPQMRDMLRVMLKKNGYVNLNIAESGKQALKHIAQKPIDLVITDWNMPEMNGLDLTKWVRANAQYGNMPILMVTTRGNKEDVIEAMKVRVNNYIVKPFTAQGLKEKIDAILKTVEIKPA